MDHCDITIVDGLQISPEEAAKFATDLEESPGDFAVDHRQLHVR